MIFKVLRAGSHSVESAGFCVSALLAGSRVSWPSLNVFRDVRRSEAKPAVQLTSLLVRPQSVHASLLHRGWRQAAATQPTPPAPLPPGPDLWPRGPAVGADGPQRRPAPSLHTQTRLLGGTSWSFTHFKYCLWFIEKVQHTARVLHLLESKRVKTAPSSE